MVSIKPKVKKYRASSIEMASITTGGWTEQDDDYVEGKRKKGDCATALKKMRTLLRNEGYTNYYNGRPK